LATGMREFIRQQEKRLACRFLNWRYEKMGLDALAPAELEDQAVKVVDEAHRIARETGGSVMTIIKELINDLKKK
jgi:hypothetical protein